MEQIITHLSDTDKYKLTMMQEIFFKKNGHRKVRWKTTIRTDSPIIDKYYDQTVLELKKQVMLMHNMQFNEQELEFFASQKFHKTENGESIIDSIFIEYLRKFRLDSTNVIFDINGDIWVEGTWVETTLWETYILSMFNEIFTSLYASDNNIDIYAENVKNIFDKIDTLKESLFPLIEFGTRRRASYSIQEFNINALRAYSNFVGTSNMYFAMKYNLPCIGTMAHELFLGEAAFAYVDSDGDPLAVRVSHRNMMNRWDTFYNGNLNIFLSDTFGTDAFLEDFKALNLHNDPKNGTRQDSGDPIAYAKKINKFYTDNDLPVSDKSITFSDGLTIEKADDIYYETSYTNSSYGIGTSITNDCGGYPISVVLKLAYVWDEKKEVWVSTVKLSDNANKAMGEPEMVEFYKKAFNYKNIESNNTATIY